MAVPIRLAILLVLAIQLLYLDCTDAQALGDLSTTTITRSPIPGGANITTPPPPPPPLYPKLPPKNSIIKRGRYTIDVNSLPPDKPTNARKVTMMSSGSSGTTVVSADGEMMEVKEAPALPPLYIRESGDSIGSIRAVGLNNATISNPFVKEVFMRMICKYELVYLYGLKEVNFLRDFNRDLNNFATENYWVCRSTNYRYSAPISFPADRRCVDFTSEAATFFHATEHDVSGRIYRGKYSDYLKVPPYIAKAQLSQNIPHITKDRYGRRYIRNETVQFPFLFIGYRNHETNISLIFKSLQALANMSRDEIENGDYYAGFVIGDLRLSRLNETSIKELAFWKNTTRFNFINGKPSFRGGKPVFGQKNKITDSIIGLGKVNRSLIPDYNKNGFADSRGKTCLKTTTVDDFSGIIYHALNESRSKLTKDLLKVLQQTITDRNPVSFRLDCIKNRTSDIFLTPVCDIYCDHDCGVYCCNECPMYCRSNCSQYCSTSGSCLETETCISNCTMELCSAGCTQDMCSSRCNEAICNYGCTPLQCMPDILVGGNDDDEDERRITPSTNPQIERNKIQREAASLGRQLNCSKAWDKSCASWEVFYELSERLAPAEGPRLPLPCQLAGGRLILPPPNLPSVSEIPENPSSRVRSSRSTSSSRSRRREDVIQLANGAVPCQPESTTVWYYPDPCKLTFKMWYYPPPTQSNRTIIHFPNRLQFGQGTNDWDFVAPKYINASIFSYSRPYQTDVNVWYYAEPYQRNITINYYPQQCEANVSFWYDRPENQRNYIFTKSVPMCQSLVNMNKISDPYLYLSKAAMWHFAPPYFRNYSDGSLKSSKTKNTTEDTMSSNFPDFPLDQSLWHYPTALLRQRNGPIWHFEAPSPNSNRVHTHPKPVQFNITVLEYPPPIITNTTLWSFPPPFEQSVPFQHYPIQLPTENDSPTRSYLPPDRVNISLLTFPPAVPRDAKLFYFPPPIERNVTMLHYGFHFPARLSKTAPQVPQPRSIMPCAEPTTSENVATSRSFSRFSRSRNSNQIKMCHYVIPSRDSTRAPEGLMGSSWHVPVPMPMDTSFLPRLTTAEETAENEQMGNMTEAMRKGPPLLPNSEIQVWYYRPVPREEVSDNMTNSKEVQVLPCSNTTVNQWTYPPLFPQKMQDGAPRNAPSCQPVPQTFAQLGPKNESAEDDAEDRRRRPRSQIPLPFDADATSIVYSTPLIFNFSLWHYPSPYQVNITIYEYQRPSKATVDSSHFPMPCENSRARNWTFPPLIEQTLEALNYPSGAPKSIAVWYSPPPERKNVTVYHFSQVYALIDSKEAERARSRSSNVQFSDSGPPERIIIPCAIPMEEPTQNTRFVRSLDQPSDAICSFQVSPDSRLRPNEIPECEIIPSAPLLPCQKTVCHPSNNESSTKIKTIPGEREAQEITTGNLWHFPVKYPVAASSWREQFVFPSRVNMPVWFYSPPQQSSGITMCRYAMPYTQNASILQFSSQLSSMGAQISHYPTPDQDISDELYLICDPPETGPTSQPQPTQRRFRSSRNQQMTQLNITLCHFPRSSRRRTSYPSKCPMPPEESTLASQTSSNSPTHVCHYLVPCDTKVSMETVPQCRDPPCISKDMTTEIEGEDTCYFPLSYGTKGALRHYFLSANLSSSICHHLVPCTRPSKRSITRTLRTCIPPVSTQRLSTRVRGRRVSQQIIDFKEYINPSGCHTAPNCTVPRTRGRVTQSTSTRGQSGGTQSTTTGTTTGTRGGGTQSTTTTTGTRGGGTQSTTTGTTTGTRGGGTQSATTGTTTGTRGGGTQSTTTGTTTGTRGGGTQSATTGTTTGTRGGGTQSTTTGTTTGTRGGGTQSATTGTTTGTRGGGTQSTTTGTTTGTRGGGTQSTTTGTTTGTRGGGTQSTTTATRSGVTPSTTTGTRGGGTQPTTTGTRGGGTQSTTTGTTTGTRGGGTQSATTATRGGGTQSATTATRGGVTQSDTTGTRGGGTQSDTTGTRGGGTQPTTTGARGGGTQSATTATRGGAIQPTSTPTAEGRPGSTTRVSPGSQESEIVTLQTSSTTQKTEFLGPLPPPPPTTKERSSTRSRSTNRNIITITTVINGRTTTSRKLAPTTSRVQSTRYRSPKRTTKRISTRTRTPRPTSIRR